MSTVSTVEHSPRATDNTSNLGWLWVIVLVLILAGTGVAIWLVLSDDDQPTLAFDGTAATYSGPTSLQPGEVTFTLENRTDTTAGFLWGRHVDESRFAAVSEWLVAIGMEPIGAEGVTMEHEYSWSETHNVMPPFAEETFDFPDVAANTTIEATAELTEGRYTVLAWDPIALKPYPAAIIEVIND